MAGNDSPPIHPRDFGKELRRLRSSAGLSLDDIRSETKISRRILEALEEGRFQFLPDKVFSRNFVRQYAGTIGCDGHRLVAAFDTAWERFELTSGTHPALLVDDPAPGSSIRWRFWIPMGIGVFILIVAALFILRGNAPRDTLLVDPRRPVPTRQPSAALPTSVPQTVVAEGIETPSAPAEVVRLKVRVDEDKECWINYRDGEGNTDQRLLMGGEELLLELIGPVKFTAGNAAAVTLEVAGRAYRDLGTPGQVIHTEVSAEGVVPLGAGSRND